MDLSSCRWKGVFCGTPRKNGPSAKTKAQKEVRGELSLREGSRKKPRDPSPSRRNGEAPLLKIEKIPQVKPTPTNYHRGRDGDEGVPVPPQGGQSRSGVGAARQRESFPSFLKSHSHRENLPNGIRTSNLRSPMTPARPRDHALKRALSRTSESSVF